MLYGDGQTHGKYEFSLNADGTDYDWDHATNVDTQEQIALAPEEGDTDAQAALDAFHQDNSCYTSKMLMEIPLQIHRESCT
mgnify:CR=1 FL=1